MGNVCCGAPEETKGSLIQEASHVDSSVSAKEWDNSSRQQQNSTKASGLAMPPTQQAMDGSTTKQSDREEDKNAIEVRKETLRLQGILESAGRQMVAVRSTRGSTAYHDQGFAAALYQHIEQTTRISESVVHLPEPDKTKTVLARLSKPLWQDIRLGDHESGVAGCGDEDPIAYVDRTSEAYLDKLKPTKDRMFSGLDPMVDSLL